MFNPLFFLSVGLIFLSLILSARYRKSLRTLHRIEVIGITSLVLVVLLYFFGLYKVPSFWTAIVLLAIIIVAFVVIIWSSINRRIVFRWPIARRKPVDPQFRAAFGSECSVDVYLKRKLPRIEDLLSKASNEIYFMGLTLEALRQIVPSIAIALRSNRKIRVLLFEPNKDLTNKVEKLVATSNITEDISRTINSLSLSSIQPPLTEEQKNNLDLRRHDQIPTHSMIVVDPYIESSGYLQIEPYPFGITSGDRRVFCLNADRKDQKVLFGVFLKGYNNLWQTGTKISIL